jgi:SNF2 family DNA or RNA helicase
LNKEIQLIVNVDSYQFFHNSSSELGDPLNNRQIMDLLRLYNATATLQLNAYKNYQKIRFELEDDFSIGAYVRETRLPHDAIHVIIRKQYCILQNNLYFFSQESVEELSNIFDTKDVSTVLVALGRLGERGLTDSELESYSSFCSKSITGNSNVKLSIKLYPYQEFGLRWLSKRYATRKGALLADDMGLGKTAQVIALIANGLRSGNINSVLAVVPNSLIANWMNEFKKFTTGISPLIHWGPLRSGFSQSLRNEKVVITTYTTVANDAALFNHLNFDLVIFDEASLLKNPDSLRTKAANRLNFGTAIAVTGTPFENSMMDLWSITNVISRDYLGSRDKYSEKYVKNGLSNLEKNSVGEVEQLLQPILLRRMKEAVLTDLPPKIDIYKPLTMGEDEESCYQRLENTIRNTQGPSTHAFTLISDFRKFSAHPLLYENRMKVATIDELRLASSKFMFLESLLKQVAHKKEKALIFANHIALIDSFKRIFNSTYGWATYKVDGTIPVEDRQSVIDVFSNAPEAAFLFLNPVTAGMGLNITSANHVIHYSRQWNPALEEQATARAYRNGQLKNVNVYYLYYANSIEETIHNRIFLKQKVASNLIRATAEYLSEEQMIFDLLQETKGCT